MAISFGRAGSGSGSGGVQAVFVEAHQSGSASPSNATWTGLDTHTDAWQLGGRATGKAAVSFGVTTTVGWTNSTSADVDYQVRVMARTSANATGPWTTEVPLNIVAGGDIAYRSTQHTSTDTTTRKNLAAYVPFALSDLPNNANFADGRYIQFGLSVAIDSSPSPNTITVEDSYLSFTSFGNGYGVPPDGFIRTNQLADGSVTNPKLADSAVNSSKIEDGSIQSGDIASGAILTANLADDSITSPKFVTGAVDSAAIGSTAVTEPKLADQSVSTRAIQDGSVTAAKLHSSFAYSIPDGGVTTEKLADHSVTGVKLASGAVDSAAIASGSVGSAALASGAVTGSKIQSGAVNTTALSDASVTGVKIAARSITESKVASGAIVPSSLSGIDSSDAGKGVVVNSDGTGFVAQEGGSGGGITSVQPDDLDGVTGGATDADKFIRSDSTGNEFRAVEEIIPSDLGLGTGNAGRIVAVDDTGGGFDAIEHVSPSDLGLDEGLDQAGRIVGYDSQGTGFLAVDANAAGAAPTLENITGILNVAKGGTGISASSLADLRTKLGITGANAPASLILSTNADTQQDRTIERTDASTASVPTGVADGLIVRTGNDQWLLDIESGKQWARTLTDDNDGVWTTPVAATLPKLTTEADFRTLAEDGRGWTDVDAWLPSFTDGSKPSKVIVGRNGDYLVAIDRNNTFWAPRPVVATWASIPWRWEGNSQVPDGLLYTGGERDEERIPAGSDAVIGGKTGIDGEEYITLLVNHELASGVSTYTGYFVDDDSAATIRSVTNTRGYTTGTWARVKADIDGIADTIIIEDRQSNDPVFLGITPATDQFELTGYSLILQGEVAIGNVLWTASTRSLQIYPKAEDAHFGSMMRRGARIEIHKDGDNYIRGVVEYYHAENANVTLARLRQADLAVEGTLGVSDTVSIRAWGSALLHTDIIAPPNLGLPVGADQAGRVVAYDSTGTGFTSSVGGGGGGSLTDGSVISRYLASNSVTNSKLASNSVSSAKIQDGAITQAKINSSVSLPIADGAVDTDAIADGSITQAKLHSGVDFPLADGEVTTEKLALGAVNSDRLGADAVTGAKLADDSVGSEHLKDDAVGSAAIADGAVDTARLADDALTPAKMAGITTGADSADHAIALSSDGTAFVSKEFPTGGGGTPGDNSITTAMLQDDSVTEPKIAENAVGIGQISNTIMVSDTDADGNERAAFVGVVPAISDLHFADYRYKTTTTGVAEGDVVYIASSRTVWVRHKEEDTHLTTLFAKDYEVSIHKDDSNYVRGVFDQVRTFNLGGVVLTGAIYRADDLDVTGTIAVNDTVSIRGHKAVLTKTDDIEPVNLGLTHGAGIANDAVLINSTGTGFTTGTAGVADGSITTAKLAANAVVGSLGNTGITSASTYTRTTTRFPGSGQVYIVANEIIVTFRSADSALRAEWNKIGAIVEVEDANGNVMRGTVASFITNSRLVYTLTSVTGYSGLDATGSFTLRSIASSSGKIADNSVRGASVINAGFSSGGYTRVMSNTYSQGAFSATANSVYVLWSNGDDVLRSEWNKIGAIVEVEDSSGNVMRGTVISVPTSGQGSFGLTLVTGYSNLGFTGTFTLRSIYSGSIIAPKSVYADNIADNAIENSLIVSSAVDSRTIASDAVNGTKIADDSINQSHVRAQAIRSYHISPGEILGNTKGRTSASTYSYESDFERNSLRTGEFNIYHQSVFGGAGYYILNINFRSADSALEKEFREGVRVRIVDSSSRTFTGTIEGIEYASNYSIFNPAWRMTLDNFSGSFSSLSTSENYTISTLSGYGSLIESRAIDTIHLADGAVTSSKLASDVSISVPNNSITQAMMTDDSIGADELIDDSVTAAAIADNAVTAAAIADNAVTAAAIAADAIDSPLKLAGPANESTGGLIGWTPQTINYTTQTGLSYQTSYPTQNGQVAYEPGNNRISIQGTAPSLSVGDTLAIVKTGASITITISAIASSFGVTRYSYTGSAITLGSFSVGDSVGVRYPTGTTGGVFSVGAAVGADSVNTAAIQNAAVTAQKLAAASVTNAKLGTGAVTAGSISTASIAPNKLTDITTGASAANKYIGLDSTGNAFELKDGGGGGGSPGELYLAETGAGDATNSYSSASSDNSVTETVFTSPWQVANRSSGKAVFYYNGRVQHSSSASAGQTIKANVQVRWASTQSGVTSATNWTAANIFNGQSQFLEQDIPSSLRNEDQNLSIAVPFELTDLPSGAADGQWIQFRVMYSFSSPSTNITWTRRAHRYYGFQIVGGGSSSGSGASAIEQLESIYEVLDDNYRFQADVSGGVDDGKFGYTESGETGQLAFNLKVDDDGKQAGFVVGNAIVLYKDATNWVSGYQTANSQIDPDESNEGAFAIRQTARMGSFADGDSVKLYYDGKAPVGGLATVKTDGEWVEGFATPASLNISEGSTNGGRIVTLNSTGTGFSTTPQNNVGVVRDVIAMRQEIPGGSNNELSGISTTWRPLATQTGEWTMANRSTDFISFSGGGLCWFGSIQPGPVNFDMAVWVRWKSGTQTYQSWNTGNTRVSEVPLGSDLLMVVKLFAGGGFTVTGSNPVNSINFNNAHVDCAIGSGDKWIKLSELPTAITDGTQLQFTLAFKRQNLNQTPEYPNFTARRWWLTAPVYAGARFHANY